MKRSQRLAQMDCSIARTLDIIGEWWTPLVLREIFFGRRRFEEMLGDLGIARNILADRLATLVDHGIVHRHPYSARPLRYEYHLTERGAELLPVLVALMTWGDRWLYGGEPPMQVLHKQCGHAVDSTLLCATCGVEVTLDVVKACRTPKLARAADAS